MKRSRKSNRVSWAPAANLCQVKLFMREEYPSKVGDKHQDTLQAKTSQTLHSSGICANKYPSAFEGGCYAHGLKYDLAEMPSIQWTCPPKFELNFNWHVAAGEESEEVKAQKLREMRVLEAVYPRPSFIPSSPSVSLDVEMEPYDDSRVPLVPLTPIEDEEGADVSDFAAQTQAPSNSKTAALQTPPDLSVSGTHSIPYCPSSAAESPALDMPPGVSSDAFVAVSAALTTVMKSQELGSLIDTDLLVKILSDPKMVEKLIHEHGHLTGAANGNVVSTPLHDSEPETRTTSLPPLKPPTTSSPMPANTNSNHLVKEFQPPLSNLTSKADIVSVSPPTTTRVESSVPPSSMVTKMISGHGVANGNPSSTLNQVQPALRMMPAQPNSVQNVQPAISSAFKQQNAGVAVAAMAVNPVKDANYIKNLIREHGREKREAKGYNISQTGSHFNHMQNPKLVQNLKPVASKTKFRKACMFFNTTKGCRLGSNCPYLHDKSFQCQTGGMVGAPSAKRMKLGREITGMI